MLEFQVRDLLLSPVVVQVIEVPEFSPEMAEQTKFLECNVFQIESLVIPFDLPRPRG
jgi:hypothetical protein